MTTKIRTSMLAALALLMPFGVAFAAMTEDVPFLAAEGSSIVMPELDLGKAANEDALTDTKGNPGGWRYALPFGVDIGPTTHSKWTQLPNHQMQWQFRVQAPSAMHLNFGFTTYWLPEGAELRIEATDGTEKIRPFTANDNESHQQLWTPPIASQDVTLTLTVPADHYREVQLVLGRINQGYRGFTFPGKICKSGNCNTDVACLANDDSWNRERRSVAAIGTRGERLCTGSLLNNTARDRRMLFATATHCTISAGNAPSVITYWNFESPTCRRPGSLESGQVNVGPTSDFLTGARLLAATPAFDSTGGTPTNKSDWTLIELDDPPNQGSNPYWAGWDRSGNTPSCTAPANASATSGLCASIHHPNGDEKRITFSEETMQTVSAGNAQNVHWQVQWDSTPPVLANISGSGTLPPSVTEPGSSGSPLFNANHLMVGVLSGGASFCGAATAQLNDKYGKLAHAWDGLGTSTTRMRDYLDPTGSGVTTLTGLDSGAACTAPTLNLTVAPANPNVDEVTRLSLGISGGTGPYTVEWDVDGDGVLDRTATGVTSTTTLAPHFVRATSTNVRATVRDAQGCSAEVTRAINVAAPDIVATANTLAPVQLCGDNDTTMEPGERWAVQATLQNSGGNDVDNGIFVFAPGTTNGNLDPAIAATADSYGYTYADNTSPHCRFQAVDMSARPFLTPVAARGSVNALDDGAVSNLSLGPNPFDYYGQAITQLQMSTNGYLSTSQDDGGGRYGNSCGILDTGANNGVLLALHDDLVVQTDGGLRHAYFSTCPRPPDVGSSQGCTVFEWQNMGRFTTSTTPPTGAAVIQAILYDQSYEIVYQYVNGLPDSGGSATIGIQDATQSVRNDYSCNQNNAPTNRSVCFFHPSAQPDGTKIQIDGQPWVRAGTMASGGSMNIGIPFLIPSNAACGSGLTMSYLGMADDTAFSARSTQVLNTVVGNGSNCNVSSCTLTSTPKSLPRSGLYQNLNRLGSGTAAFNIPRAGNATQFASVWYTAKDDRSPYWYTQGGNWNSLNTQVSTDITETRQTGANPFAVSRSRVGNGWVTFVDDSAEYVYFWNLNGTMVGEKQLRFVNETGFAGDSNRSGGWFNPTESGWGVTVTDFRSGSTSIRGMLAFLFDADGEPRWMTGSTTNLAPGAQVSATTAFTHCPVCPNLEDFSSTSVGTGTMQMNFTNSTNATFNSTLNFPASIDGSWNRTSTPMILITPPF